MNEANSRQENFRKSLTYTDTEFMTENDFSLFIFLFAVRVTAKLIALNSLDAISLAKMPGAINQQCIL